MLHLIRSFYIRFDRTPYARTYKISENGNHLTEPNADMVRRIVTDPGVHSYRVAACNAAGCSPESSPVSINIPEAQFSYPPAYFETNETLTITTFNNNDVNTVRFYVNDVLMTELANINDDADTLGNFVRVNQRSTKTKVFFTPGKVYCVNATMVLTTSVTMDSADPNRADKPTLKQCQKVDGPLLDFQLNSIQKLVVIKNLSGIGHFSPLSDPNSTILTDWAKLPFSDGEPVGNGCSSCKSNYYNSFIHAESGGFIVLNNLEIADFSYGVRLQNMVQFQLDSIENNSFLDRLIKIDGNNTTINYVADLFDTTVNDSTISATSGLIPGGNWNSAVNIIGANDNPDYLPPGITTPVRHVCLNGEGDCLTTKNSGSALLIGSSASNIRVQHVRGKNVYDNCVYVSSGNTVTINDVDCKNVSGTTVKVRGPNMKISNIKADNSEVGITVQNIALDDQPATNADIANVTITNARSIGVALYRYNYNTEIREVNLCGVDVSFGANSNNTSRYGLITYGAYNTTAGHKNAESLNVDRCDNLSGNIFAASNLDFGINVNQDNSPTAISQGLYFEKLTDTTVKNSDNGAGNVLINNVDNADLCITNPGSVTTDGPNVSSCP